MKKKNIQNITIAAIATLIIGSITVYSYSVDQTKQQGLQFGMELEQVQQDLKELQTKFYSKETRWKEGDISKDELLNFYDKHLKEFKEIIARYDELTPPELFKSSVELLKLSSVTQLKSDIQYIKWIRTGDESARIRSDAQFQEALEYELAGLAEFYSAKTGVKNYNELEKFKAPQNDITQKVIQIAEKMKNECEDKYRNELGAFDSEKIEVDWFNCINEAKKWKTEHLP